MDKVVGKCSKCGGFVIEGSLVTKPTCCQCGAVKKEKQLPVIEMDESTNPQLLLD